MGLGKKGGSTNADRAATSTHLAYATGTRRADVGG